ncbi:hypothetical protein FA15DRAFT_414381 [Coprinopsis marcescibilis]|uniref:Uncharacterized protein n=1 Tax=Coprinopsis marcescibilis TaxID=230819 RepID=A0A5C3KXH7_COPMA|nr:hypothetical protein FA15DRAFT_414381 [Coprinopsis marcescibilis]
MSLVQETEKPEGEVVAVSVNSSRSAVLANQQLLAIILDAFSGDDLCLDRRKTLLAAALSCRVLYEPAMDCLWGSIHDLTPLFQLVPGATIQGQQYVSSHIYKIYGGESNWCVLTHSYSISHRITLAKGSVPRSSVSLHTRDGFVVPSFQAGPATSLLSSTQN